MGAKRKVAGAVCFGIRAMSMHGFCYPGPVGGAVLHNRKSTFFNKKGPGINLAHELHAAVPLSPVLDKFNGLRQRRKGVQTGDCKEYGKLVRQLFLKLTIK